MNNLAQRAITSVIGASVLIFAMVWNVWSLIIVLYVISFLVHLEYLRTVQQLKGGKLNFFELMLSIIAGFLLWISQTDLLLFNLALSFLAPAFIFFIIFAFFIFELFLNRNNPFQNIALNITGLVYCSLPFIFLYKIAYTTPFYSSMYDCRFFVLAYFLIIWTNDVMAYFTGRTIGRHKLFERISPKKTWEGFFGGLIFSVGTAVLISRYLHFLNMTDWIIVALIISIFGTLGDLVESMLKRSLQLKDSSNILPGHGGFLDRFDGSLIAAPFVYLYLQFPLYMISHSLH